MRLLVRKLFCAADVGKIEKNSYMSGMIMSMLAIVICLIAMCGSAYAFFTSTLTSECNVIQAAEFDIDIIESENSCVTKQSKYIYMLNSNQTEYNLVFELLESGTATTGYAKVIFELGEESSPDYQKTELYTKQIVEDGSQKIEVLMPLGYSVKVTFVPQWGTYSGTNVINASVAIAEMFNPTSVVETLEEEEKEEPVEEIFCADICVTDTTAESECTPTDGVYGLEANKAYTVTLTAKEDNTAAKGYGIISVNGQEYYVVFDSENSLTEIRFTINTSADGNFSCSFAAGELPEDIDEEKLITSGSQIGEKSEIPEDTQNKQEELPIQQEPPVQPEYTENQEPIVDSPNLTPEPQDPAEPAPQVEEPEIIPTEEVTE